MKYLRSSVRRASCRANPVHVKAVVTQRADNTFAPAGAERASRALILPSPVAVFICNRPRLEHLFGKALANEFGSPRTMEDRRWQKVI